MLAKSASKSVKEYVEKFRAGLPNDVLIEHEYSFSVFLVPRVVNRDFMSDVAVEFIKIDETSAEELERQYEAECAY